MVNSGFTLLELVMVMMLLCVVAAMAVPALRGFGQGRRLGSCAAQLVSLAQYARTQAITRGVPYRMHVDPDTATYWLTAERDDGVFDTPGDEFGRVFEAPEGIAIDWLGPSPPDAGRFPYVEFLPTGRTSAAATLRLTDEGSGGGGGAVTEVACLSPAEPFRVLAEWEMTAR